MISVTVVDCDWYCGGSVVTGTESAVGAVLSSHPRQRQGDEREREADEEVVDAFSVVVFVCGICDVVVVGGCVDGVDHCTWYHAR